MRCALLVEQHAVFRQAMAYLLARDLRVELVEEASTLAEARALALENLGGIDVVVSELALPDGDGTEVVRAIKASYPESRVAVLSSVRDLSGALSAGADEVLNKNLSLQEAIGALGRLASGGATTTDPARP